MYKSESTQSNFHARHALASRMGPSAPPAVMYDPSPSDEASSSSSISVEVVPYQLDPMIQEKNRKVVPPEPLPKQAPVCGFQPPPMKSANNRPPGGCFPTEPIALEHFDPHEGKPKAKTDLDPIRIGGTGSFSVLSDQLIAKIATFINGRIWILSLSATSRAMYQIAHWESRVWKPLALLRWGGDFVFKHSWKLSTFFDNKLLHPPLEAIAITKAQQTMDSLPTAGQEKSAELDESNPYFSATVPESPYSSTADTSSSEQNRPPIKIPGFYSAPMYREWFLSQLDINGWYHDTGQIPRIRAQAVTDHQFKENFSKLGQPVIITDVVETWPAWQTWHPDLLLSMYSDTLLKVNEYTLDNNRVKMSFRDFLAYMRTCGDHKQLYVFDDSFESRMPQMLQDFAIPTYFWEDLFAALEHPIRPPFRWFLMGAAKSGSPFHQDPNGTSAWNALIHGHKRWALYPPWMAHPPGCPVGSSMHILKWYTFVYPFLQPNERPIEFVQNPGELVFIPSGWWHAVLNLDETVSVTQNFVNLENLDSVINSLVHSSPHPQFLDHWKARILPLRPELVDYMSTRVQAEKAAIEKERADSLQATLDAERRLHDEENAKSSSREATLLQQIEELKQEIQKFKQNGTLHHPDFNNRPNSN